MIAVSLLADDGTHRIGLDNIFPALISSIKIKALAFVLVRDKLRDNIGVMDAWYCGMVGLYKFWFLVNLRMTFVSIMFLIPFLSPTCVNVLVVFLVWLVVPKFISLAVLDGSVFPASVALPGGVNEDGVIILPSLKLRPFASSNWRKSSNRVSNTPALTSLFLHAHTVFLSGTSLTVCMFRNSLKLVRSILEE